MEMARVFLAGYLDELDSNSHSRGMSMRATTNEADPTTKAEESDLSREAELDLLMTDCMLGGFFLREVGMLHWNCFYRIRTETETQEGCPPPMEEFVAKENPRKFLRECKE